MTSILLSENAAGNGKVAITAPRVNADITFTLPSTSMNVDNEVAAIANATATSVGARNVSAKTINGIANDISLLYLHAAENKGDRTNMSGGIMDPLLDETDINKTNSVNQVFTTGSYSPVSSLATTYTTKLVTASMFWPGTMRVTINGGTLSASGNRVRVGVIAFDAVTFHSLYIGEGTNAASTPFAAAPQQLTFNGGSPSASADGGANAAGLPSGIGLVWSDWLDFAFDPAKIYVISTYFSGGRVYYNPYVGDPGLVSWFHSTVDDASVIAPTGYTNGLFNGSRFLYGVEVMTSGPMIIESKSFTASSSPATARIGLNISGNFSINTSIIASVSRDGGASWTNANLALIDTLADGTKYYEDDAVDLGSQPSGTSMEYKITDDRTMTSVIQGVILQWS